MPLVHGNGCLPSAWQCTCKRCEVSPRWHGSVFAQVVDFTEALSAKQLLFWRAALEELLRACADPAAARAIFARFAGQPALASARGALTVFLRRGFGPWLAARSGEDDGMLLKLHAAEAGLAAGRS